MRLVSSHTFTSELSYLKTVRPAGVPIRWKNLQNMLIADHWKEKHSNIYIYIYLPQMSSSLALGSCIEIFRRSSDLGAAAQGELIDKSQVADERAVLAPTNKTLL